MVLPLESLAAHRADVLPLVAVRQLVFRKRRCVVEHLAAYLRQNKIVDRNLIRDLNQWQYMCITDTIRG